MKIDAGRRIKSLTAIIRPEYVIDVMRGLGCAAMVAVAGTMGAQAGICSMRTCGEVNPVSIDVNEPVFSWQMVTDTLRQNQRQTAWRIEVVDADGGNCVWDSGRRSGSSSVGIKYEGLPLRPETRYRWRLHVWDEKDTEAMDSAFFETAILDTDGWDGARWIGAPDGELPLYAPYLAVFDLAFTVQTDSTAIGPKASVVYGANDFRLMDRRFNILGVSAGVDEAYVRVEFDVSRLPAVLRFYRAGYTPSDVAAKPLASVEVPDSIVCAHNRFAPHRFRISSVLGTTRVYADGSSSPIGKVELNPMGVGGDFIAFPVLGDVGFTAGENQTARFSDVEVRNFRSPSNLVKTIVADTIVQGAEVRTARIDGLSAPMLRTEFDISRPVVRARLYATARGAYTMEINGKRVSDEYLAPGLTQYNRTHQYQVTDVTELLHPGRNALGAQLSEGWWSGAATYAGENWNVFGDRQSLLARLVVIYTDGSREVIVTDPSTWQVFSRGPVRSGSLFQGEVFDGQLAEAMKGWSSAGFDTSGWMAAVEVPVEGTVSHAWHDDMPAVDDYSDFRLAAARGASIHAVDTITAQSVTEVRPGTYVYDMGVNMAGVPLIRMSGLKPGTQVAMRFAEVLYPHLEEYGDNAGMLMLENIRAAMARDVYTAAGGEETYSPTTTYHGYRYVEITGVDRPLPPEDVKGIVLSSVRDFTAGYECSSELVNALWGNIRRSMQANFMSVPTDCPQRNERLGWSGDISVFAPTATYMADVNLFLRRHMQAMRDVQRADGKFLDVAPIGNGFGGILWGSAGIVLPWQCYVQYADTAMLAENYDAMCRYLDFIGRNTIDSVTGIIVQNRAWGDLGDWLGPEDGRNDKSLLWEAYYIHDLDIMADAARVLGREADAQRFTALAAKRREFFARNYIDGNTGTTVWSAFEPERQGETVGTQTSYVLPLAFGIVPDSVHGKFVDNLAHAVTSGGEGHEPYSLLTGFIGTAWISRVLSDVGLPDMAYSLLLNTSFPSWLYPVTQGATTVWERLDSYTHSRGFGGNNRMNSFNHYSFGAVGHWLMSRSLGIEPMKEYPGFASFELRPQPAPAGMMDYATGHYDSPYGRIESSWKRNDADGSVTYQFTIPANTQAQVTLPGMKPFTLGSGRYSYSVSTAGK